MSKKVLITEKPSVAMEFAKVLKLNSARKNGYMESEEWLITWCVGHLVTMSYPDKYDEKLKYWRLETLPFLPEEYKYEVIPQVENQFNVVKSLLTREDVSEIYVCTDSGREGEYIYRLVDSQIGVTNKKKKRVWIDSQTEEEILKGINNAKELSYYDSLADSAYLRAKEDYLIGINFSRFLSIIYGRRVAELNNEDKTSISVGRVMTCVLGMIVEREREIREFIKTKYYKILGTFGNEDSNFEATWKVNETSPLLNSNKLYNENGFKAEEDAKDLISSFEGKEATVTEIKKNKQKENPPLLFNLAELQNECTKNFKIKPDETLEVVQALYEKKLVTYPRTDARVLSTAVAKEISKNLNGLAKNFKDEEIQKYISKMVEEKYSTNIVKSKYVNDSKITDHYAIIPTGQGLENYNNLSDLQKNVYKMIVKRFLAIFYPAAEFNKVSVEINIENEKFFASGKVCIKEGYLFITKNRDKQADENKEELKDGEKEEDNNTNIDILNKLKKGQKIEAINFETKEAETSPPTRYNSGSIILAMENAGKLIENEELREQIKGAGIGTSATRAEIMKKLERIGYININNKTQIITPEKKGEIIYNVVKSSIPDMLNPELTASWEKGLEMVYKKEITKEIFMEKLEKYIRKVFNKVLEKTM